MCRIFHFLLIILKINYSVDVDRIILISHQSVYQVPMSCDYIQFIFDQRAVLDEKTTKGVKLGATWRMTCDKLSVYTQILIVTYRMQLKTLLIL